MFCLIRTVRHVVPAALGLTQPSRVMPLVRSSVALSATVTQLLEPLKLRAPPYLPEVLQVVFVSVPVLFLPDESGTVVPSTVRASRTFFWLAESQFGTSKRPGAAWPTWMASCSACTCSRSFGFDGSSVPSSLRTAVTRP